MADFDSKSMDDTFRRTVQAVGTLYDRLPGAQFVIDPRDVYHAGQTTVARLIEELVSTPLPAGFLGNVTIACSGIYPTGPLRFRGAVFSTFRQPSVTRSLDDGKWLDRK